jgi:hypothetical protein
MGLLQFSQMVAARDVMNHAAARGARARTVGFNAFMVRKVVRAASIATAGRMVTPEYENVNLMLENLVATESPGIVWDTVLPIVPHSAQTPIELARIPFYLGAESPGWASIMLDYEDWDTISYLPSEIAGIPDGNPETDQMIQFSTRQNYPLRIPMHRAFYAADSITLQGQATIESHYPLYLEDLNL